MRLNRPVRRTAPETIIALIDVVFFLLVFFMLIGRMDATAPFEILPPQALTGSDMPAGGATVAIGADGSLALDAEAAETDEVLVRLLERLEEQPALLIRINAHRDARLKEILPLVAQIEALGAQDVMLVVTPSSP